MIITKSLVLRCALAFLVALYGASELGKALGPRTAEFLGPRSAEAQVPTPVIEAYDIKLGYLDLTWKEGEVPADQLRMRCGPVSKQYNFTRIVAGAAPVPATTRIMMADLLPKPGLHYCVFVGAKAIPGTNPVLYVEGTASSEIPFAAVDAPSGQGTISRGSK
jgi:hypothetical protein